MKLPIYDITINMDDTDTGMCCCSLVEDAAVSVDFLAFNKETEDKQHQLLQFKNDGYERKIFGCAIRCNYPIYRIDSYGREFYVRFNKEVIEQIVLKYSKEGLHNLVSLNHDGNLVEGITLVEMFIKNTEKGISPIGFEDIEDGSLFVTYKVEDDNIWNEIINKNVKGFSIEIISDIVPTNETIEDGFSTQEPEKEEDINSFIEELYNYLVGEGIDDVEILFADSKKKIIEQALKDKEHIAIKTKGKSKTFSGWIYANVDNTLYVWDNKEFHIINTKNIDTIKITPTSLLPNWESAEQHPFFPKVREAVRNVDNVTDIGNISNNIIYDSIMNHKIVMLRYEDGEGSCEGYRQCLICEYGITRAGNTAIRAYEYSGDYHHEDTVLPEWRTFLIKRLRAMKLAPEGVFKPITQAPPKFNPDPIKDRDNFTVIWKSVFE